MKVFKLEEKYALFSMIIFFNDIFLKGASLLFNDLR